MTEAEASRRNLLTGLAAAGVALPLVAACGSSSDSTVTGTVPSTGTSPGGAGASTPPAGGGGGIPTSEIPVGGGRIFPSQGFVVTQPTAGQFKAFSSVCTHQGCPVTQIERGTIVCTCHGSQYSIKDGSVEGGPAPSPLPEKTVTVTGNSLTVT